MTDPTDKLRERAANLWAWIDEEQPNPEVDVFLDALTLTAREARAEALEDAEAWVRDGCDLCRVGWPHTSTADFCITEKRADEIRARAAQDDPERDVPVGGAR